MTGDSHAAIPFSSLLATYGLFVFPSEPIGMNANNREPNDEQAYHKTQDQ